MDKLIYLFTSLMRLIYKLSRMHILVTLYTDLGIFKTQSDLKFSVVMQYKRISRQ